MPIPVETKPVAGFPSIASTAAFAPEAALVEESVLAAAESVPLDGPLHEVIGADFYIDATPRTGPPRREYLLKQRDRGRVLRRGPDRVLVRIDRAGVWPLADLPVLPAPPSPYR